MGTKNHDQGQVEAEVEVAASGPTEQRPERLPATTSSSSALTTSTSTSTSTTRTATATTTATGPVGVETTTNSLTQNGMTQSSSPPPPPPPMTNLPVGLGMLRRSTLWGFPPILVVPLQVSSTPVYDNHFVSNSSMPFLLSLNANRGHLLICSCQSRCLTDAWSSCLVFDSRIHLHSFRPVLFLFCFVPFPQL